MRPAGTREQPPRCHSHVPRAAKQPGGSALAVDCAVHNLAPPSHAPAVAPTRRRSTTRAPAAPDTAPPARGRLTLRGVSREMCRALADAPGNEHLRLAHDPTADGGRLTIEPPCGSRPSGELRLALRNVPPAAFRELRDDPRNDAVRMTYAPRQGRLLELSSGRSAPPAESTRLIDSLIAQFCPARSIDCRGFGGVTLMRDGVGSLEGGASLYVRSYDAVRGKEELDFDAGDPVPDLAVEVVVSNPLADKPAVYADLGVGELWVWRDGDLAPSVLTGDGYEPADDSPNLPGFPFALAADLLRRRAELGRTGVLRAFAAGL